MSSRFFTVFAVLCAASPLLAQTTTDTAPDQNADALAGPAVTVEKPARSLVVRDFDGDLTIIDERPELAAVRLFTLDAERAAAYKALLDERAVAVARFLDNEYALLLELQAARQGGNDPRTVMPLMRKFRAAAGELVEPPLRERVAAVLPENDRAEYLAVVDEYLAALAEARAAERSGTAASEMAGAAEQDRPRRRSGPAAERIRGQTVELSLTVREVAASLGALVDARRERSDELMMAINATPEQEAKLRAITREMASELGKVKPEHRAAHFSRLAAELTPEQRRLLLEFLRKN